MRLEISAPLFGSLDGKRQSFPGGWCRCTTPAARSRLARGSSCGRGRVAWPRLRTVIITYSLDLCYAGRLGRLPSFGRGASGYASMTAAAALAAPTAAEVHHGLLLLNKLL